MCTVGTYDNKKIQNFRKVVFVMQGAKMHR